MYTDSASDIAAQHSILKRLSRKFTLNAEESSDLVQDTILKALTYKESYRENTNLQGWLFTIMRNTFINNYRKAQRASIIHDNTPSLYLLNVEDPHTASSPEGRYTVNDLWKTIEELKEEWAIPFKLHVSGYKYHEIADHLKIPVGTVKNRIFHARKEIQKRLVRY